MEIINLGDLRSVQAFDIYPSSCYQLEKEGS